MNIYFFLSLGHQLALCIGWYSFVCAQAVILFTETCNGQFIQQNSPKFKYLHLTHHCINCCIILMIIPWKQNNLFWLVLQWINAVDVKANQLCTCYLLNTVHFDTFLNTPEIIHWLNDTNIIHHMKHYILIIFALFVFQRQTVFRFRWQLSCDKLSQRFDGILSSEMINNAEMTRILFRCVF